MTQKLPVIYGLWIGSELSTMEILSMRSFLAHGHEYHLYVYEEIANVPPGIVVKDASTIIPYDKVFKIAGSYAGFSDGFRYKLLLSQPGFWADTDVICIKPFVFEQELVFATERIPNSTAIKVASCVIGVRQPNSEVMAYCYERTLNVDLDNYRWGMIGPDLVTQAVKVLGLQNFIQPPEVFCAIDYWNWSWFTRPFLTLNLSHPAIYAVHLWHQMWKVNKVDENAQFPPNCVYEQLKRQLER